MACNSFTKHSVQGLHWMFAGVHSCRIFWKCPWSFSSSLNLKSSCSICHTYLSELNVSAQHTRTVISSHPRHAIHHFLCHGVDLHMDFLCSSICCFVCSCAYSNETKFCLKKCQLRIKFTVMNRLKIPITKIKSFHWIMLMQEMNCDFIRP
jgi:hypothetical protein